MKQSLVGLTRLTAILALGLAGLYVIGIARAAPDTMENPTAKSESAAVGGALPSDAPSSQQKSIPYSASFGDADRKGQTVDAPRYEECRRVSITADEATPTIELASRTADVTVVAEIQEIGAGRYNAPEGVVLTAADVPTEYDVYRPALLRIETVVAGELKQTTLKVRLPGGTVGCDEYRVEKAGGVQAGSRFVLFLDQRPDAKGNAVGEMTVIRAWQIDEADLVTTPADGIVSVQSLRDRSNK